MNRPSLMQRARAYISEMDGAIAGNGGDKQTFKVCIKVVEFGLGSADAMTILGEYNTRCQPAWSENQLRRKLRMAYNRATPNQKFVEGEKIAPRVNLPALIETPKWPPVNDGLRQKIVASGINLAELKERSPALFDGRATDHVLEILFPNNPLICMGRDMKVFWTKPLSEFWGEAETLQFIVPSPMSKLYGKIQDPEPNGPKQSMHTLDNTGPRKFAVVECDHGTLDEQASFLWHLSEIAPLIAAVHSGKKSLHGWFYVLGQSESKILKFYRYAVSLGADRASYTKSQFVRIPDGTRNTGERQTLHYFNPHHVCLTNF